MMNKLKYIIISCMLFISTFVYGQQIRIEYTGTDSLWISELWAFAWNKQVPLNFENDIAVYQVNKTPKVLRLVSKYGFSSLFMVGDDETVEVKVVESRPLKIEVKGDKSSVFYHLFEKVNRQYIVGKKDLIEDYMKAYLNNDTMLAGRVEKQLNKLRNKRDKAYWKVFRQAVNAGKINDVLVIANIPLELKYQMFDQLEQREIAGVDQVKKMLDLYAKIFTPAYVYNMFFYPCMWGDLLNMQGMNKTERNEFISVTKKDMEYAYYLAACNRACSREVLEDLSSVIQLRSFDRLVGYHMELDEQAKRDTLLRSLTEEMEKTYLTRSGIPFKNFTAETSRGEKISLSDYRGKYVLLDFWASWCGPCRNILPEIRGLYDKYYPSGKFDVLGISKDKDRQKWLEGIKEEALPWKNILFSEVKLSDKQQFNSVTSLPQLILIGPDGKVLLNVCGADKIVPMRDMINNLFEK